MFVLVKCLLTEAGSERHRLPILCSGIVKAPENSQKRWPQVLATPLAFGSKLVQHLLHFISHLSRLVSGACQESVVLLHVAFNARVQKVASPT